MCGDLGSLSSSAMTETVESGSGFFREAIRGLPYVTFERFSFVFQISHGQTGPKPEFFYRRLHKYLPTDRSSSARATCILVYIQSSWTVSPYEYGTYAYTISYVCK